MMRTRKEIPRYLCETETRYSITRSSCYFMVSNWKCSKNIDFFDEQAATRKFLVYKSSEKFDNIIKTWNFSILLTCFLVKWWWKLLVRYKNISTFLVSIPFPQPIDPFISIPQHFQSQLFLWKLKLSIYIRQLYAYMNFPKSSFH